MTWICGAPFVHSTVKPNGHGKASPAKSSTSWSACKRVLGEWPRPGILALLQELYRLSEDNRRFLHARLLPQQNTHNLEQAVRAIRRIANFSSLLNGGFRHADLRRIVDQFEKATNDPAAVAELLLADLQATAETLAEIGDCAPIVDHMYASMARLDQCLKRLDPVAAIAIVDEMVETARRWYGQFGYGVSDELHGMARYWQERIGPALKSAAAPPSPPQD